MKLNQIRIVVADDHKLIREGIKKLLELNDNIKIVGEASNGEELIEVVNLLKPDLAITDINMPFKTAYKL